MKNIKKLVVIIDEILNWIKQNKNIEIKSYEDKLKEMKDCH